MAGIGATTINPQASSTTPDNVNIAQVGGFAISQGQKTMANSFPVVIASDQAVFPIQISDGTNIASTLKSDGTAAGQNALITSGTGYSTGTVTLNAGSPNTVWYDMLNYSSVSLEILTNTTPATLTFQTSGDASQTNVRPMPMWDSGNTGTLLVTTTAGTINTFSSNRTGRYFRISSNVAGGNTVTLVLTFYTNPTGYATVGAQVQGYSASASSNSGNPLKAGVVFTTTQPTVTSGQVVDLQATNRGAAFVATGVDAFTVQPGNTANTTPWLVDIHATGAALADSTGNPTTSLVGALPELWDDNAATWSRQKSTRHGLDTLGTGIAATGLLAELDDTSPTSVTENQFGPLRMGAKRSLHTQLRDAAGNDRGANIDASNNLMVNINASSGTATVAGAKTNNNAAPGATNIGALPALANAAVPVWTEGNLVVESVDLSGNQRTTLGTALTGEDFTNSVFGTMSKPFVGNTYTPSVFISAATVTANIKASAGNLYSFQATNANAAVRYVQFFNTATTPGGGATAILTFLIPAGTATAPGAITIDRQWLSENGFNFATGIAYGFSSAATTYTAGTASDHFITGTFI